MLVSVSATAAADLSTAICLQQPPSRAAQTTHRLKGRCLNRGASRQAQPPEERPAPAPPAIPASALRLEPAPEAALGSEEPGAAPLAPGEAGGGREPQEPAGAPAAPRYRRTSHAPKPNTGRPTGRWRACVPRADGAPPSPARTPSVGASAVGPQPQPGRAPRSHSALRPPFRPVPGQGEWRPGGRRLNPPSSALQTPRQGGVLGPARCGKWPGAGGTGWYLSAAPRSAGLGPVSLLPAPCPGPGRAQA